MAILASEALLREKKSSDKMLPSVGIEPGPLINSDSKSNLTSACKTETLGSLYNHALLILLKSLKSKYQVVKEQKFKDLLSSTCPVSVESMVLDLESEGRRRPGSIPTGGNILSLNFLHVVKPLMPILPLLPILSICEKLDCRHSKCEKSAEHSRPRLHSEHLVLE